MGQAKDFHTKTWSNRYTSHSQGQPEKTDNKNFILISYKVR